MQHPDTGSERRGRHAAPPAGPLSRVVAWTAAAASAGAVRSARAWERFRAGPVLPWISAHRMLVLVAGALLVSTTAFGATALVIGQASIPVAGGDTGDGGDDGVTRPRPETGFTMPSPVPTTSTVPPTSSPGPSAEPTVPADAPALEAQPTTDPEPTADPVEPTADPTDTGNGRPDPPGATNRPDKKKG